MNAERTGGIRLVQEPTVDEIVGRLGPRVWKLLRAGEVNKALVLLEAEVEDFQAAWRREYVGITPEPTVVAPPRAGCTSLDHSGLDCSSALAQGLLAEGVPFCTYCTEQQAALPVAPEIVTETGTVVRIVTPAGATKTHSPATRRVRVS